MYRGVKGCTVAYSAVVYGVKCCKVVYTGRIQF